MSHSLVKSVEIPEIDGEEVRKAIIKRIEKITVKIIEDIDSEEFPKIIYHDFINNNYSVKKNSDNQYQDVSASTSESTLQGYSENCLSNEVSNSFDSSKSLSWIVDEEDEEAGNPEEEDEDEPMEDRGNSTTVDFRLQRSRKNLILMMTVMSDVHKMLITKTTKTRRSLYYQLRNEPTAGLVKNQKHLDDAVNRVASLLQRAPWELGLTATSKGLIFGELELKFSGISSISCKLPGGLLIPQNIHLVKSLTTKASCVVVVEKDTIFQKLLEENCPDYLNCILITGKGYPDINTRMLVSILGNRLKIPIYVLVDSDPFGIEIMCIYRFGSFIRSREDEILSCSSVRYLGIHPSEYSALGVKPTKLTAFDKSRLKSLEGRSYVRSNEKLLNQLKIVEEKGKIEIEDVSNFSRNFLTNVYINKKIEAGEFI